MSKITLLRSAAVGAVLTFGMGAAAHAADSADCTVKCVKPVHHAKHHAAPVKAAESPMAGEVAALKAEVASLEQRLDASNAAAQQAQAAAAQAAASAQAAQTVAQNEQTAISQIPGDVDSAVAKLPKPKNDAWYFKGVKFTPGGFIAAESAYRSRGLISDGATSPGFANIPYRSAAAEASHTGEWRQSARQSRVSGLAEADVTPDVKLTAYGEFDFLGAAQTANSNESNSYNLRIRHLYTTVDFKNYGLSVLAGQTWSLLTLNDQGITPRKEVIPLTIDAQYAAGFAWARQPQIRVTENFGHGLWAAFSIENPQTNSIGGTASLLPGYSAAFNQAAGSGSLFNSANNYSFNHVPDLVAKVAYDNTLVGHHVHVEAFGLYRDFYDRVQVSTTTGTTTTVTAHNTNTTGGGAGFGAVGQIIPGLLDGQVSGMFGQGIGRYGSSQFSDVYQNADGSLQGIKEGALLAGLTLHATPKLDVYGYAGEERAEASSYTANGKQGGYGNPLFSNLGGCELAGEVACSGNTKYVEQAVLGFWHKAYSGDFGSFKWGIQASYTKRDSFSGIDAGTAAKPTGFGSVSGDDTQIYTSIRYYPFQK